MEKQKKPKRAERPEKPQKPESKNVRIRVVRLSDDEEEIREESVPAGDGRKRNTELSLLTIVFSAMFLLLAGYMVWFHVRLRPRITSNPYNTKQDTSSEGIIRGPIVTEDGTVLASTSIDYTGNEVRYYPYSNIYAHTVQDSHKKAINRLSKVLGDEEDTDD